MTNAQTDALAASVRVALKDMTPEERATFLEDLTEDYCEHCWGPKYPFDGFRPCQCWNDE